MATFQLPPTSDELLYPPGVDNDDTLRIWAFSPRRSEWQVTCAFLDAGYGHRWFNRCMYSLDRVAYGRGMTVRFVNPLDARLLYGRGYHYDCEMVVFTRANIWTNYDDYFPYGRFVHQVPRSVAPQPGQE